MVLDDIIDTVTHPFAAVASLGGTILSAPDLWVNMALTVGRFGAVVPGISAGVASGSLILGVLGSVGIIGWRLLRRAGVVTADGDDQ
jgi:hypothetical protein